MIANGYVAHAARNRRFTGLLLAAYVAAFELIGAFALTMLLLVFDHENTILSNPLGYALRYGLPIAALSGWLFWSLYRGHAKAVTRALDIRAVTKAEEPRFVSIAEIQCITLGIHAPRFGVIEAEGLNALTVGEGPDRGLIAVTRGLLDNLDDDELAAVLAHEVSHIRQGDTRVLAANHALMRTAVTLQTQNPLRLEDYRQMIIPILLPPMLLPLIAGGAATMLALQLARFARRGLKLGRDHIADGEAIRVTHFPEALIGALNKVSGRSAFPRSYTVEGLLFDGPADHEGGSHPAVSARIEAIATLGKPLMMPGRERRDTRQAAPRPRAMFGRRAAPQSAFALGDDGRPHEAPPTPSLRMLSLWFTDREEFWRWQRACIAWQEWRVSDRRNALGLKPMMVIPVAATCAFLAVFHWPSDKDPAKFWAKFSPTAMVNIAREVNGGPFCNGPSFPDGTCKTEPSALAVAGPQPVAAPAKPSKANAWSTEAKVQESAKAAAQEPSGPPSLMPFFIMVMVFVAFLRPDLLRKLFGVVDRRR